MIAILAVGLANANSVGSVPFDSAPSDFDAVTRSIIQQLTATARVEELRWPNFSDYAVHVRNFYEQLDYSLAWIKQNQPTQQARTVIQVLQEADNKGLNADDYDSSRWSDRLSRLQHSPSPEQKALFDVALTICLMRYISDLHIGRVNPQHVKFALDVGPKKYDLPSLIRQKLVASENVRSELEAVEPPFTGYKRTRRMLQHYLELAREDDGEKLPIPEKPLEGGTAYAGIPRLTRLLRLLGDLASDAPVAGESGLYGQVLVSAVKHFQQRHGLPADGHLGKKTLEALNTPLAFRVEQLRLTLERWRWIPYPFPEPPIVVNIPEFRLRAFGAENKIGLASRVIVGKSYRHQTPVFVGNMLYVVFRPYWNVTPSIQRSEIVPAIRKNRNYIADKNYEVTTAQGAVVTSGVITDDVLQQLSAGKLLVRQRPGPANALGLVKLMFPNEYHVYLHSTPSATLFSQSRRDFSHGCIRVEKAAELAAWVLRDKSEWTLEKVRAAMENGPDNAQVNLSTPIPVLILYGTAVVDEENQVHFFDDIYGHDAALAAALGKGYPYPN